MKRPHGFTLLELTVSATMLAVLLATSMQMLRVLTAHRRAADRRVVALQAVQAVAEQVGNLPWDQLTVEAAQQIKMPAQLAPHLPGATLTFRIEDEPTPVASKRIMTELKWSDASGRPVAPARLTTWTFRE